MYREQQDGMILCDQYFPTMQIMINKELSGELSFTGSAQSRSFEKVLNMSRLDVNVYPVHDGKLELLAI
jgi:hypothetical protein